MLVDLNVLLSRRVWEETPTLRTTWENTCEEAVLEDVTLFDAVVRFVQILGEMQRQLRCWATIRTLDSIYGNSKPSLTR